ncbi:PadR family transcriptional regulator [Brevundimonas sp.]|jgi:DNA-binding PadR family transcriptional regulator|uniref:PadR family transcriptional regulator n=1 Tax=Brevundimonas sp. TaxID=1871086 RepID=UPI00391CF249|nr:helix-turn-helix transcriptional regulator [Brevundimonas sp.]
MARRSNISPQTRRVFAALAQQPQAWRHGYDLSRETSVKSGTLYPLLMRLTDQGLLEAEWRQPLEPGRPPRHAYRLTSTGVALAAAQATEVPAGAVPTGQIAPGAAA